MLASLWWAKSKSCYHGEGCLCSGVWVWHHDYMQQKWPQPWENKELDHLIQMPPAQAPNIFFLKKPLQLPLSLRCEAEERVWHHYSESLGMSQRFLSISWNRVSCFIYFWCGKLCFLLNQVSATLIRLEQKKLYFLFKFYLLFKASTQMYFSWNYIAWD